jgi:hypothetical protein
MKKTATDIVEDIWLNTHADTEPHPSRPAHPARSPHGSHGTHPAHGASVSHGSAGSPNWNSVEEANMVLNPDPSELDRG